MYPVESVQALLNGTFVLAKVHLEEGAALAKRFNVTWTPALLFLDGSETVHHRILPGSLPVDDFVPAIKVGLGKGQFDAQKYDAAIQTFQGVIDAHARSLAVPEALYWRGVCFYKKGDKAKLVESWKSISANHPGSFWAKAITFLG